MMLRVVVLVLALCAPTAFARAADISGAEAQVRATADQMINALRQNRAAIDADPKLLYGLVDEILLPRFDFERMSRAVLGRIWKRASTDQRARFVAQFRKLLVRTYGTALASYRDQTMTVVETRELARGGATVRTRIEQNGGPAIPIDYRLHHDQAADWRVSDVAIDGVSLVINYRSSFAAEVRRGGIDGLIARLVEHNNKS